jgi:hypothetical protein
MKKLLLLLLTPFCFQFSALATNYYVTPSGAGAQTGTDPANAWSLATYGQSTLPTGGDTVFFLGTFSSTVTIKTSGTGNGALRLTLDFTGATLNTALPRIACNAQNYLNVNGGTLGSATTGDLITIAPRSQSHDITIQNWKHTGDSTSDATFIALQYCYNLSVVNNTIDKAILL